MIRRHQNRYLRRPTQHGFTLVELLVAIGILVALMAIAIPALKVAVQGSKGREAARMVSAYCMAARSRAVETGRPVGLWIERSANNPNQAFTLFMAEVPSSYSGDFLGALAVINALPGVDGEWGTTNGGPMMNGDDDGDGQLNEPDEVGTGPPGSDIIGPDNGPDGQPGNSGIDDDGINGVDDAGETGWIGSDDNYATFSSSSWNPSQLLPSLVKAGDFIRFNHQGPYYEIEDVLNNPIRVHFSHPSIAVPGNGQVISYEIERIGHPVRSSIGSIELPKGTIIDLDSSGVGATGSEFDSNSDLDNNSVPDGANPIIILFSPDGGIDRVVIPGIIATRTLAPLYLLVGRDDENEDNKPDNLDNPTSLWVSIGHVTGTVTSAENAPATGATLAARLAAARSLARQAQIMKGS